VGEGEAPVGADESHSPRSVGEGTPGKTPFYRFFTGIQLADNGYRKSDRSVDVYVGKLRHKLEQALPGERLIHTHFGFGYRFAPERS
jgi:hypothetical protein